MNDLPLPPLVWRFVGSNQDGPSVCILGGTHGDEMTGIEVVRRFLRLLGAVDHPAGVFERSDVCGNLFVGFGNPEAILRRARGASQGRDLNRCFLPEEVNEQASASDSLDQKRAKELAPLFAQLDFFV